MNDPRPLTAFRIDGFIVEPERNMVRSEHTETHLEPKVMAVLCALAEQGQHVVSRSDLLDTVWGSDDGSDESLTRAISILRATFRKRDPARKLIETVPRRGYRLACKVEHNVPDGASPTPDADASESAQRLPSPSKGDDAPQPRGSYQRTLMDFLTIGLLVAMLVAILARS